MIMYKYFKPLMLCLTIGCILSCQNDQKDQVKPIQEAPTALKPLPQEIKEKLFASCEYIDYTFYNFNFSMSQGDPNAVKSNLALLSDEVQPNIPQECKPIGRKYYHIDGEIVAEAELYFSENCFFYIYKKDNTTLYGNKLSAKGITFYNNIIQQASRARQQPGG